MTMAPASSIKTPLVTDIASGCKTIPSQYVRPISDRPDLYHVDPSEYAAVPIIDLEELDGVRRAEVVNAIGVACQNDGFFQIRNHGIPEDVTSGMLRISKEFFHLPESERMKSYSEDPAKTTRLSTSFNVKTEKFASWRDFLRLHCHPLQDYVHEWPSDPTDFKDVVGEYSKHVRVLALRLLAAISESLGLEKDHMEKALGKQSQQMAINYYPPCPQPELTYGLPVHKDPTAITLLLQDPVSGLQVLRDGKWIAINPLTDAFVINIGDQVQVLSNDRYKSVLHRVVVNNFSERISVPTFYFPSSNAVIKPAKALIDEGHPALYRSFTFEEYFQKFWNRGLKRESCLDMFRTSSD